MYLVVTLNDPLELELRIEDPRHVFRTRGRELREVQLDPAAFMFLGFYDWLRSATGDVVGVQLLFHEGREHVQNVLRRARVGNLDGDWFFQVVFEDGAAVDPEKSVDQEFSVSRCYEADDGSIALLFDASALEESDLRRLVPGRWR
jgi:hypothetical protein